MALFLSICMPLLSFGLTLRRPVSERARVAIPWSASIEGHLRQPHSLGRKKGLNRSKVTQEKTWCYPGAPAVCRAGSSVIKSDPRLHPALAPLEHSLGEPYHFHLNAIR